MNYLGGPNVTRVLKSKIGEKKIKEEGKGGRTRQPAKKNLAQSCWLSLMEEPRKADKF